MKQNETQCNALKQNETNIKNNETNIKNNETQCNKYEKPMKRIETIETVQYSTVQYNTNNTLSKLLKDSNNIESDKTGLQPAREKNDFSFSESEETEKHPISDVKPKPSITDYSLYADKIESSLKPVQKYTPPEKSVDPPIVNRISNDLQSKYRLGFESWFSSQSPGLKNAIELFLAGPGSKLDYQHLATKTLIEIKRSGINDNERIRAIDRSTRDNSISIADIHLPIAVINDCGDKNLDELDKVVVQEKIIAPRENKRSSAISFFAPIDYTDIDPIVLDDLKKRFMLIHEAWSLERRGSKKQATQAYEEAVNRIGIDKFVDDFEKAIFAYFHSEEAQGKFQKSLSKFLDECENWVRLYTGGIEKPGDFWIKMNEHREKCLDELYSGYNTAVGQKLITEVNNGD